MIKKIWLLQPLAFARVGSSTNALQNFYWAENDLRPEGSGRTQLALDETLEVSDCGCIKTVPDLQEILFKDGGHIRPVCPFFELHGEWEGGSGAITAERLKNEGYEAKWRIDHANLKAFHLTKSHGDRIEAECELPPKDAEQNFRRQPLYGSSPKDSDKPLIPKDRPILMGQVQAIQPTDKFPEIRLRFFPPPGRVYGPTNLPARLEQILKLPEPPVELQPLSAFFSNSDWAGFALPDDQCILNPDAAWTSYGLGLIKQLLDRLPALMPQLPDVEAHATPGERSEFLRLVLGPEADVGNLPPGIFAFANTLLAGEDSSAAVASLGLIDDMGDGIITCTLEGKDPPPPARARIVVSPPTFAPDRRHPISIADGLKDREDREEVRKAGFFKRQSQEIADSVFDLFDRAFETAGLANLDAWNEFFREENAARAAVAGSQVTPDEARAKLWNLDQLPSASELPLTYLARRLHRRLSAREILEDLFREQPDLIRRFIREPSTQERLYDQRMPALMRGADRQPLHVTRRQFEILTGWAKNLK